MTPRSKLRLKSLITSSFFNSRLKIFWDNLRPLEWTFTRQTQVFPYGTVELSQNSGPNFKVNGHRLKHYFGGDIPTEDFPDCENSRARSFTLHPQEFHIPSFILGIQTRQYLSMGDFGNGYHTKDKKKAKNKQNRARNGKDKVKSKPKLRKDINAFRDTNCKHNDPLDYGKHSDTVCYNCQGEDHYASNCTVKPRKLDAAYLQKQMQIAQKEEAGIQLTYEEFDFMAAVGACKETKRANANCTLENNLQHESSLVLVLTKAPVYAQTGSAEYMSIEPIPEPHQVQQNDSNVISVVSSVEQSGGTVEQHPANIEETRAYFESLYNNLATEVEKVNLVNRKMERTNVE
ncbi:retrovirus-related pol polyprotein from transposon TNT 1-94 [Tanacetum coccineum]